MAKEKKPKIIVPIYVDGFTCREGKLFGENVYCSTKLKDINTPSDYALCSSKVICSAYRSKK